jgi:hypothetical protein
MDRKFLIIVEDSIDTETDWFDQLVSALDENGIISIVHEVTEEKH